MSKSVPHKFPGGRSGGQYRDWATSFEVNFREEFRRGSVLLVES